jgi:hypothetical protein
MFAAVAALLALAAPPADVLRLPSEKRGTMEARLTVHVEPLRSRGFAEMTWTLEVEGPPLLEVKAPVLLDVDDGWEVEPTTWATLANGRVTWVRVLRLAQAKAGEVTLPSLSVSFREGPDAPWQEARWTGILSEIREGLRSEPAPPVPPATIPWWLFAVAVVVVVGLVAAAIVLLRRPRPAPQPPTPAQQALAELDRVEQRYLAEAGDAGWFHTQLSTILRRFLAERFHVRALQQTTAEFQAAIRAVPEIPSEQKALLWEVLERCDLARFARAAVPPEECQRLADLVRAFIRQAPGVRPPGSEPG